jgi:hypothetical protein
MGREDTQEARDDRRANVEEFVARGRVGVVASFETVLNDDCIVDLNDFWPYHSWPELACP